MPSLEPLFSPARLGRLETKDRLVMPAMVRNYADERGRATPRYRAHIERVARGGVGTLILEASFVRPDGRGFAHQLGLHDDAVIDGLAAVVEAVHEHDAVVGPQIYHAGRQTQSEVTGERPLAPSAIPDPLLREVPRALSIDEIQDLVRAFAEAARRAEAAGSDFVEIHGAHGYLITQFLSPFTNQRDDAYGGTPENRMRFLVEIIEGVRGVVSPDLPLLVRLSCDELVPGGLTPEDTIGIARRLEAMGVAALDISAGNYASFLRGYMMPPMAREDGVLVPLAARVKEAVGVPVIAVGKLRDPALDAEVLRTGKADFIAIGSSPVRPRIQTAPGIEPTFAVDLLLSKEDARSPVIIAGGGCAGAQTAESFAARGHEVTIIEMTDAVATEAPLDDRALLLERLRALGVAIRTGTRLMRVDRDRVSVESELGVEEIPAATVVYCLGARPNDGLPEALKGVVSDIRVVGDAVEARQVTEAVAEGALAVLAIERGTERIPFDHDLRLVRL